MERYAGFKYFAVASPAPFVAHVEINRPTKLNAFKEAMWLELRQVFEKLSVDPDVRAVVLSGAGDRAFTAGLDVQEASQNGLLAPEAGVDGARKAAKLRRHIAEFQECISSVEKCEKPVIAVLHGISIGLAIDISCCADVRIASKETRFAVKEVDIGLAADIGTLARLPKVVGSFSWVKEVCLTARDFSAAEALQVGFVSQVHESKTAALDAGLKMASFIASKSPVAVQGTKEVLNHSRDHSVDDNLRYVGIWNAAALQTTDVPAALMSGMQKRKPTFEKL
ncbi:putative delta-delta-dienoyl-CoA isomerase mitochondrial precursor [Podospora australis]|uniref:Delta-delta-dienoyl-CoA isomerase mitochondrial n=1 Tax=Podospora australis TaxID=1536484 RepID=A0AAN7AN82_9PEZI|nr:putative delta-delta-dienoyl-CoA isomerase mitochondrial precursor [Podospora australis]